MIKEIFETLSETFKFLNETNAKDKNESGDMAQIGSSGNRAQIESLGAKSVTASIGYKSIAKAKVGSWITLAEYRVNKDNNRCEVYFVKTEFVDGKNIKKDTFYCLYNKEFREFVEIDGVSSALLEKKKNVYKVVNFADFDTGLQTFIVEKDGVFSHGKTIKEAKADLIYKISNRDTSEFKNWTLETEITLEQAIKSYRVITGACEYGTKCFCKDKELPKKLTVKEVIKLTEGEWGNQDYKDFFKNNKGK